MKKKFLGIIGLLVLFVIALGAWRRWVEFVPPDETPTVTLPSPNAYDFYVKAGQTHTPAPKDLDPIYDNGKIPEAQWKTHYPIARKEEWLRKNNTSLRLLREGFKYPCRVPPRNPATFTRISSYASLRELSRKLSVESNVYSEKRQWAEAAGSALDSLHLGCDLSQGGNLIDYLVGAAINAMGRSALWKIIPHLHSSEALATGQRLKSILAKRVSYPDLLRNEKQFTLREYRHFMRSPDWNTMELTEATGPARWKELWQIFSTPRRTILNNHENYMNAVIAVADKPYSKSQNWPPLPTDFYHQHLPAYATYPSIHFTYAKEQAADALLLTSLALRAYRLDNQRYPQTLNELVPRYFTKNPIDSFGNGKPLHYQPKNDGYVLYSLGPDGVSNQGQAIRDPQQAGKGRREFVVQMESKGDFVAGINY